MGEVRVHCATVLTLALYSSTARALVSSRYSKRRLKIVRGREFVWAPYILPIYLSGTILYPFKLVRPPCAASSLRDLVREEDGEV